MRLSSIVLHMMHSAPVRRVATFMAASVMATSAVVGVAPAATAAPGGNIVYVGDSFAANPDQIKNRQRFFDKSVYDSYPSQAGCLQSPDNTPRLLQRRTGIKVHDWSCAGNTSLDQIARLQKAAKAGHLNRSTRAVVLGAGMNNHLFLAVKDKRNPIDYPALRRNYLKDMKISAAVIRAHAPKAKMIVVGTLSITDRLGMYCAINVVPDLPGPIPGQWITVMEVSNQSNQRAAAKAIGARFIDIRSETRDHSSCAKDDERYVAGIIDVTTPNYNMMFHPSLKGSDYVAKRVAAYV